MGLAKAERRAFSTPMPPLPVTPETTTAEIEELRTATTGGP
jgi:hypothetical protein